MRLRLRIERNELPPVSVLWSIGDTELKQTVAQFLERVNERFPLEGESWGLEDYAISVGGYEALHYNEVGTCFQSEDEVLIKPLQYVDSRARTITGRDQITEDGRHLLDGVPFGKPLLKRPRRPEVRIPPRKRHRVEEVAAIENGHGDGNALVLFEEMEGDEDEDDEDDEDFEMEDDEDEDEDDGDDEAEDEAENDTEQASPTVKRSTRRVAFADTSTILPNGKSSSKELEEASSSEDSSDSSDNDESSDSSSDSSDSDSDASSDYSSSDSSDSSGEEWNGIVSSNPTSPPKGTSAAKGQPTSIPRAATNGVQSDAPKEAPFGEGEEKTRTRNARRREQRQLKHLKESGMLAAGATMTDMRHFLEETGLSRGPVLKQASRAEDMIAPRQKLLDDIASGGVDITSKAHKQDKERKESPAEEANEASYLVSNDVDQDELAVKLMTDTHKRLDVAGMNRMVFGSLGVRTPTTQADKDALQKKLLARSQRAPPAKKPNQVPQAVEEEDDSDSWQDRIEISAVECCDEGITLSAPPFPFQQRWDPQYQSKKRRGPSGNAAKRQKKRRINGAADGEYVETYDKYNTDGTGDALNYDDPEDDDDEYWEDGALLDDDYGDEDESVDDGFPKLPDDISTLPAHAEADAKKGDFIVYTELSCSAATKWEPKMMTRTARLNSQEDDGWKVTFARRDLPPKEYDEDGNRVYSKFEMEGVSDEEDEDEFTVVQWAALQEPRLLQRASE